MSDLIYAGAAVFGGITLLIEANRSFNSPVGKNSFGLSPILQDVAANDLCTSTESRVGFAFYAAFYLLAYVLILGSSELLELLISASAARAQVGAIDGDLLAGEDAVSNYSNYGKPLFVSALLISFMSISYVQKVEGVIRGLALQFAGVPRSIYRVMDTIRGAEFDVLATGYSTELADRFEASIEKVSKESRTARMKQCDVIKKSLVTVDCLITATSDRYGQLYFPVRRLEQLKLVSDALNREIDDLRAIMVPLEKPDDNVKLGEYLDKIEVKAGDARANTIAVFALLFLRNNRTILSQNKSAARGRSASQSPVHAHDLGPIEHLRRSLKDVHDTEQNALAMGASIAALIGGFVVFGIYQWWYSYVAMTESAIASYLQTSSELLTTDACEAERACRLKAQAAYQFAQAPLNLTTTIWDVSAATLMIVLCVFFTIESREYRMDEQSWNSRWRLRNLPFLRLLSLSMVPGGLAVLGYGMLALLRLAWDVNFQLTETQILTLVDQSGWFILLQAGNGLILAFATLAILDRHESFTAGQTFLAAVVFSLIYLFYTRFSIYLTYGMEQSNGLGIWISRSWRDAAILSVTPVAFIIIFASLLEFSEGEQTEPRPERKCNPDPPPPVCATPPATPTAPSSVTPESAMQAAEPAVFNG